MSQPALPSTQHQDPTLVGWLSSHTALAWAATAALTSILGFGLALPQVATDMAQAGGAPGINGPRSPSRQGTACRWWSASSHSLSPTVGGRCPTT